MAYEDVLKILEEQARNCKHRDDYLKKQKELALSSKELSTLIGVNIANVSNKIRRMIIEDKIKVLKGFFKDKDRTDGRGLNNKKYYVLSEKYCDEEEIFGR